jgi:GNAT superfamily N-acetyltransferase
MSSFNNVRVRPANFDDIEAIKNIIAVSARELSRGYYSERQIEAAITHVFGVDTILIADRTYFVAEADGTIWGCGGWSKRRTLFGGDQYAARDPAFSDPAVEAAKIRAFFVHPQYARRGLGRAILEKCEAEAKAAGYQFAELMSTLPGVGFYSSCGYVSGERTTYTVGDGITIEFVPMRKSFK